MLVPFAIVPIPKATLIFSILLISVLIERLAKTVLRRFGKNAKLILTIHRKHPLKDSEISFPYALVSWHCARLGRQTITLV